MIDLTAVTSAVTVTYTNDEAGTITDGTDTITFTEIERVITTDQADVVDASSKAGSGGINVDTRDGDDTITGGIGADTIAGGGGNDTIDGGSGADSIDGGAGNDTLDGGAGNDTLEGGLGNDTLYADGGDDSLSGGDGADSLYAGAGSDTLDGGAGDDFLEVDDVDGSVTVVGGTGTDTLDFDATGANGVSATFTGDGAGNFSTSGGSNGTFTQIQEIWGTGQNDTIDASADSAGTEIEGQGGDDSINGGSGNDTLDGDSGDDTIDGGAGNDTILAEGGDDSLTGGDGNDVFQFMGNGHDTITDFNFGNTGALGDGDTTNNDFIDLSAFYDNIGELRADFADDGVINQSNTTAIGGEAVDYSDNSQFGAGDSITFQGASQSSFTADNTGVVCFATGTMILTPGGEVPVERLKPGDLVATRDNGPQKLVMLAQRKLRLQDLTQFPNLKPILIAGGASDQTRPLVVSPQHAILARIGGDEILLRAKFLAELGLAKARVKHGCRSVTYVHLVFEQHQIVFSNGVPSESFYPGNMALRALEPNARTEFNAIFPDCVDTSGSSAKNWAHARPTLRRKDASGLEHGDLRF